jgi:hypothetical protein
LAPILDSVRHKSPILANLQTAQRVHTFAPNLRVETFFARKCDDGKARFEAMDF